MAKVILKGYIRVSDLDLVAITRELPNHIALTRKEQGCLIFNVVQDPKDVNRFDVYEEFSDELAFAEHQRRARHSKWGEVSVNVERFYTIETTATS